MDELPLFEKRQRKLRNKNFHIYQVFFPGEVKLSCGNKKGSAG